METKYNQKWLVVIVVMELSLIVGTSSCENNRILLRSGPVSESEKWIILNTHNLLRQLLALGKVPGQPQAANLQEIQWDDQLANRAQYWATSCFSEEHDDRRSSMGFGSVGQNIATFWTTRRPTSITDVLADYPKAIKDWFREYADYSFGNIYGSDSNTGHYTQLIWHNTNRVGCGYSFYYDPVKGFTKDYICNYSPSGNIMNSQPYAIGQPACWRYRMQPSMLYQGLCEQFVVYPNLGQYYLGSNSNNIDALVYYYTIQK